MTYDDADAALWRQEAGVEGWVWTRNARGAPALARIVREGENGYCEVQSRNGRKWWVMRQDCQDPASLRRRA